mmetsp:Transcript_5215/g.8611  ORF Transcript_5215/g.8611 Transcript_5215/m.8611 type:complete len:496 (-) Transcript_5215:57-1544(-)
MKVDFTSVVVALSFVRHPQPSLAFLQPHNKILPASPKYYHAKIRSRASHDASFPCYQAASSSDVDTATSQAPQAPKKHKHTLAILTMPQSASARIANEAILETAISITTERLSVVLRTNTGGTDSLTGEGYSNVSLTQLRRYAGEIYSMAWDAAVGLDERENAQLTNGEDEDFSSAGPITQGKKLLDLIVYPQNMPNSPPEGWIDLRPDLSCICSHDSITGWISSNDFATGSGRKYASKEGQGKGGLRAHVEAVNAERKVKGLQPLVALHVDDWPDGAEVTGDPNVVFLEDEDAFEKIRPSSSSSSSSSDKKEEDKSGLTGSSIIGGTAIPATSLYSSVCVGGTFDGMHYGHRKLLTLAISSVQPISGRLLIGVTRDEMLTHKAFADRIPPLEERMAGVLEFIGNLAPGMKNRIRCVPISDEYGPPGQPPESESYPGLQNDFDALVLSHETLPTGLKLNKYRVDSLGIPPLKLLCTQRTEPHGMSSTALRRIRSS